MEKYNPDPDIATDYTIVRRNAMESGPARRSALAGGSCVIVWFLIAGFKI